MKTDRSLCGLQCKSRPPAKPVACTAPIRGYYQLAPGRRTEGPPTAPHPQLPLKRALQCFRLAPFGACWLALTSYYLSKSFFLVFLHRLTRKRVDILYKRHLVIFQIFFYLILDIRFYCSRILSYRIYIGRQKS